MALGLLAVWAGASDASRRWSMLFFGARVCDVLIVASGVVLIAAGVLQLVIRTMRRTSCAIAAAGAAGFAATLFAGVWSGAIPCSGPG